MLEDQIYRKYAAELSGEVTEETYAFLAAEQERISAATTRLPEMESLVMQGAITPKEYDEYQNEYSYAMKSREPLADMNRYVRYLDNVKRQTGIPVEFLYDTGWKLLFADRVDYCLLFMLICI